MQLKPPDKLGLLQYPELHVHKLSEPLPTGEAEWSGQAMQMLPSFRPRRWADRGEIESKVLAGQGTQVGKELPFEYLPHAHASQPFERSPGTRL